MRTTSQAWKDNQVAQLRSKSLIKLIFNYYSSISNLTYTTKDEDDDRIPYIEIDNTKKVAGIVSLGDPTWTDIAQLSFSIPDNYIETLLIDLSMNVNMTVKLYENSTLSQTLTYTNVSHIEEEIDDAFDKVEVIFNLASSADANKRASLNYVRLLNNISSQKILTNDDIIKVNVNSSVDLLNRELPKNELIFEVDNSTKQYDIYNPNSDYYKLAKGQEIEVYYGYMINGSEEWVKGGTFYITDWSNDTSGLTFQITAQSSIALMDSLFYGAKSGSYYDSTLGYTTKPYELYDDYAFHSRAYIRRLCKCI